MNTEMDPVLLTNLLQDQMPRALELLKGMVGINSFTSNREGVNRLGQITAECFEELGFEKEFVASTNPNWGNHLILTRRGRLTKNVALIAHLDTVFPPEEELANGFRFQVEGDRAYGPGTLDIKGGTVMMWLVLTALRAHAPRLFEEITWRLFWNSSEECLSTDFEGVCRQRFDRDTVAALVFEAENRSKAGSLMVAARKGRFTWKVSVQGRGAHAGGNLKQGANALVQLARLVQKIDSMTDFPRGLTFNVGRVEGGTVLNRVPHLASAEGEFRAFSPEVCLDARKALLALGGPGDVQSALDGYPCQVTVEITSESRPWPRNPATDALLKLWIDTAAAQGCTILPEQRGGLSDGNSFWDIVPTLDGLGPWGDNDHCSERSPGRLKAS